MNADINDMNADMNDINVALGLVVKHYTGLFDKNGNPAILHPLTVGCSMESKEEKIVGLLHDIVEDGYLTLDELRVLFDSQIVEAIQILTHDKKVGYEDYIHSIKGSNNSIAIRVKIADLKHNIKRGNEGGHKNLVVKHTKALFDITSIEI